MERKKESVENANNQPSVEASLPMQDFSPKLSWQSSEEILREAQSSTPSGGNPLKESLDWILNFAAQPHPLANKPGPLCPMLPGAKKRASIYLSSLNADPVDEARIVKAVLDSAEAFKVLPPHEAKDKLYKTTVLVIEAQDLRTACETVTRVQQALKYQFIEDGLMLGKFHPLLETRSLTNPNFHPMKSPYPLLTLRHMMPSDWRFLSTTNAPVERRIEFMKKYFEIFEGELPANAAEEATQALKNLLSELHAGGSSVSTESY